MYNNLMINTIKKLINFYRFRYSIPPVDLADSAETNRLNSKVVSIVFFIFGFGDLVVLFALHLNNLSDYVLSFIYFGTFTLVSICAFVTATKTKNVSREKAYLLKNIPFYMTFLCGIGASVYNFCAFSQAYNGVLSLFLTILIALCVFSFSPFIFLAALLAGFCPMIPDLYRNFGLTGLMDSVLVAVIMFCLSLYKRRVEKRYLTLLKKQQKNLVAKTFGNFTLLYDDKVIKFSRTKSLELAAYLVYKNGSSVNTKELLSVLYGDYADSAKYGASLRLLISDIKHTLSELEIQNFFIAEYNNFRINPGAVKCDYYDFLAGDAKIMKTFTGEFMSQYSWAEEALDFLERRACGEKF